MYHKVHLFPLPAGNIVLILSTDRRLSTSLWMLWAMPGYCKDEGWSQSRC